MASRGPTSKRSTRTCSTSSRAENSCEPAERRLADDPPAVAIVQHGRGRRDRGRYALLGLTFSLAGEGRAGVAALAAPRQLLARQPRLGGSRLENVETEALDRAERAGALQRAGGSALGAPRQHAGGEVVDVDAGEADL